jgi:cytochrome P450
MVVRQAAAELRRLRGAWVGFLDGPEHARLRGELKRAIAAQRNRLRESLPRLADEALAAAGWEGAAGWDGRDATVAKTLATRVMADLVGVPPEHARYFERWFEDPESLFGRPGRPAGLVAGLQAVSYFRKLAAGGARPPEGGVMGELAEAKQRGEMTDDEMVASAIQLTFAGIHSTVPFLHGSMKRLLADPGVMREALGGGQAMRRTTDELLRLAFPSAARSRWARQRIAFTGGTILAGDEVRLQIGASGFDPDVFSDAQAFDPGRHPNPHLAFGSGPHRCIGAPIVRAELAALLRAAATVLRQQGRL